MAKVKAIYIFFLILIIPTLCSGLFIFSSFKTKIKADMEMGIKVFFFGFAVAILFILIRWRFSPILEKADNSEIEIEKEGS